MVAVRWGVWVGNGGKFICTVCYLVYGVDGCSTYLPSWDLTIICVVWCCASKGGCFGGGGGGNVGLYGGSVCSIRNGVLRL